MRECRWLACLAVSHSLVGVRHPKAMGPLATVLHLAVVIGMLLSAPAPGEGQGQPLPDGPSYLSRTAGDAFELRVPGGWEEFWVRGVNLGAALPGRFPSQFPGREVYDGWIADIARMGANAIRTYTIHPPDFYDALDAHNRANPDRIVYLIQGVWTELPEDDDFQGSAFEGEYFAEKRRVVDLVHGNAEIEPRPGHASGSYRTDVSPWTFAYILGREWEPHAVLVFNARYPEWSGFEGRYVRVEGGTAMDAWLGRGVEEIVAYETERYGTQRPVAWTNWPTLDPFYHPSESTPQEEVALRRARGEVVELPPDEYENDALGLDPSLLRATAAFPAGVFAAYHAYPYYPDLMIHSDRYREDASSLGPSDYFGYLLDLKAHHAGIPVLIAEYGVPASLGPAHLQPQGWHHGGHTEAEMAAINARLTLEIAEAGMAGAVLFAWIDEWFKRNWLVAPFELPADRNPLWLNRLDAEQQYGVLAMEPIPPLPGDSFEERRGAWEGVVPLHDAGGITVRAAVDAAYLWLLVETPDRRPGERLHLGFDLIDPAAGELRWPGAPDGPSLPVGVEFALVEDGSEARILVHPPQNPFWLYPVGAGGTGPPPPEPRVESPPPGLFVGRWEQWRQLPYRSLPMLDGVYDSLRVIPNRRRIGRDGTEFLAVGYDRGVLREGPLPDGQVERGAGVIEFRIPWQLINVTDPSSRSVLYSPEDPPGIVRSPEGRLLLPPGGWDELGALLPGITIVQVEDIGILAAIERGDGSWRGWGERAPRFTWEGWEEPAWQVRQRPLFQAMAEVFAEIRMGDPPPPGSREFPRPGAPSVESSAGDGVSSPEGTSLADQAAQAWASGDTRRMEEDYRRLVEAEPGDRTARHRLALATAWNGRSEEALRLLDELVAEDPSNLDLRRDRARIEGWAGRFDQSVSSYDDLLAIQPGDRELARDRARVLSWAEDFNESIEGYRRLLADEPADVESRLGLAQVLSFADRLEEAIREYDTILAVDPGEVRALQGKGRALAWSGEYGEAEHTLREAVRLDPENADVRVSLGQLLRWQGRPARAREELMEADRLDPGRADVLEQLRWLDLALRPSAHLSWSSEGDSDGNQMQGVQLSAHLPLSATLQLRASAYRRELSDLSLHRQATGVSLGLSLEIDPGWGLSLGAGGSRSDTERAPTRSNLSLGLRTPSARPLSGTLSWSTSALDATALLAERGVQASSLDLGVTWTPHPAWRALGSLGAGTFRGVEENRRLQGSALLTRRVGESWTFGLATRGFGFERTLAEGYYSPKRFLLAEFTARWLHEPEGWTFLLEGAPGVQSVGHGSPIPTIRASGRLAWRRSPGQELFVGGGVSTSGVQLFATDEEYRYHAILVGVSWAF